MADKVELQGSFIGAGRQSYFDAPSQNQTGFLGVDNVRPPDTGVFFKRFGYTEFNDVNDTARRMFEYQKDVDNSRRIVTTGDAFTAAINEDGTDHNPSIFLVDAAATEPPRMVTSRDFGFFQDGAAADVLRWDGSGQNLLIRSEELDQSPWAVSGTPSSPTVTADATVAPDGTTTAEQIDYPATGAGQASTLSQDSTPSVVVSQQLNFAVWLRADSSIDIQLTLEDTPFTEAASIDASLTTSWQRFNLSKLFGAGANSTVRVHIRNKASQAAKTIFAWGAQLQYGPRFGTYEATTTATITGVEKWGITAPTTAIAVGAPVGGAVTLTVGRNYFLVFRNSTTGHNSDLNPVSASTGPIEAKDVPLSAIEVDTDPQTDRKLVLATADGGDQTTLFFLADIPNAQTTLTDNIAEDILLARNIYLEIDSFGEERGLSDNSRPPTLTLLLKHRGRIWGAGNITSPQFLFFSKTLADLTTSSGTLTGRYEEAWPAGNFFDISAGAESISALFTDGVTLYVGTERHIRRVLGDGQTLQKPEILFNNIGVVNQDVWKPVFITGSPAGTIFLTPDKKVIFTDFNTYRDIGEPIQDLLSSINTAAITKSYAEFYSSEGDDWYVLAVPTGASTEADTILVYDMNGKAWYTWVPADKVTAQLINIKADGTIQWLWAGDDSRIHKFQDSSVQDREGQTPDVPVSFTSTLETTWRHFNSPQALKVLNKLKLFSSDSAIAISVDGASTRAEFTTPVSIISGVTTSTGPLGDLEIYLAGKVTKDRFYKFKFVSTADLTSTQPMLSYFEVHNVPFHVF